MRLDRTRLIDLAASTGFRQETLEKVDRLIGLLDDVNRHPLLSRVLALKGGTALNLGFGPPSRLSVDLDFKETRRAGAFAHVAGYGGGNSTSGSIGGETSQIEF